MVISSSHIIIETILKLLIKSLLSQFYNLMKATLKETSELLNAFKAMGSFIQGDVNIRVNPNGMSIEAWSAREFLKMSLAHNAFHQFWCPKEMNLGIEYETLLLVLERARGHSIFKIQCTPNPQVLSFKFQLWENNIIPKKDEFNYILKNVELIDRVDIPNNFASRVIMSSKVLEQTITNFQKVDNYHVLQIDINKEFIKFSNHEEGLIPGSTIIKVMAPITQPEPMNEEEETEVLAPLSIHLHEDFVEVFPIGSLKKISKAARSSTEVSLCIWEPVEQELDHNVLILESKFMSGLGKLHFCIPPMVINQ